MALSTVDRLRQMLAEEIPLDGSETDTGFTDEAIQDLITQAITLSSAAVLGWQIKAARYAELVSTTEGNAVKMMSDLHDHAVKMIHVFEQAGVGPASTAGRSRVGRIRRPGGMPT